MLQSFIDEYDGTIGSDDSARVQSELKAFFEKHIAGHTQKYGAFVGVLRELRPAINQETYILEWWSLAIHPILKGVGFRKSALDDAQDFLLGVMVYDDEEEDTRQRAKLSGELCRKLLEIYIDHTAVLGEDAEFVAQDNTQIAQQTEVVLVAFGRQRPKDLFHALDDLVLRAETRLQALTLLSSFLRNQTPHLYLVIHTPLVEHLLKCLMNDTSTTVLSVALASLIMLMPHIPGSLGPHLPRLFLVYSRILCWEKFSPLSTKAQRNLVTDDRMDPGSDSELDNGDVGIDPSWEKARPPSASNEASTPELMTYFTYLYGLYPLNFMSYIRKPRKYLKNLEFPGADDFDLDQSVIRSRTEQFRQVHLLHPNFFNITIEEEISDPRWPKMDPADVVAECQGLCVNARGPLTSPGPPPSAKLPDIPSIPPLESNAGSVSARTGTISPSASHTSFKSSSSRHNAPLPSLTSQITEGDSPILRPYGAQNDTEEQLRPRSKASQRNAPSADDFPAPGGGKSLPAQYTKTSGQVPGTNLAFLQREIALLRNDLNFERWHKQQYSTHIGHLQRKNVREATVEAETLNLINANRALKQKLADAQSVRETILRETALGKKQTNHFETQLNEKVKALKEEQKGWQSDSSELQRLKAETKQYRALLVAAEARELNKSHKLEIVQRDVALLEETRENLHQAQRKLREFEYKEFEFEQNKRDQEILQSEKETLEMKLRSREQELERRKKAFADKTAELESQLNAANAFPSENISADSRSMINSAIAESEAKLNSMKRAHSLLLDRYTELDMEYQHVREQLAIIRGGRLGPDDRHNGNGHGMSGGLGNFSDTDDSGYKYRPESIYTGPSSSEISGRRFQPPLRTDSVPKTSSNGNGANQRRTWMPPNAVERNNSTASDSIKSSEVPSTFHQTAPLSSEEMVRQQSALSGESSGSQEKIKPKSEARVYGRGELIALHISTTELC